MGVSYNITYLIFTNYLFTIKPIIYILECDGMEKCICNPQWKGEKCEEEIKCVNDCNGNGICSYGKCFCFPGNEGDACEKVIFVF